MKECNIIEYGAKEYPNDATLAFRAGSASCMNGGRIIVPNGLWKTGAFNVTSAEILIKGTIIAAQFQWSTWNLHYPKIHITSGYTKSRDACCVPWQSVVLSHSWEHSALITLQGDSPKILGDHNGSAKILGNGFEWWRRFLCFSTANARQYFGLWPAIDHCLPFEDTAYRLSNIAYPLGRPRLVETRNAIRVIIRDIELHDSPFWTLRLAESKNILIENVKIRAPDGILSTLVPILIFGSITKLRWAPNSDGIDIDSSSNVILRGLDIRVGDDAISLKAGLLHSAKETYNVQIQNSRLRSQWLSIGSETAGGIRHIRIANCTFGRTKTKTGADLYSYSDIRNMGGPAGIHIKTRIGRGGYVDDIRLSNINVLASDAALRLTTSYPTEGGASTNDNGFTSLGSFVLSDVRCLSGCKKLIDITAFAKSPLENMRIFRSPGLISCANIQRLTADDRHKISCPTILTNSHTEILNFLQIYPRFCLILLALSFFYLARRLRPNKLSITRIWYFITWFAALGTAARSLQWLFSSASIGPGSALSTPLALTPVPISAPLLRVCVLFPVFSVLISTITAFALLVALSSKKSSYVLHILRLWFFSAGTFTLLDALFFSGYDAPLRASHRKNFCSKAWKNVDTSMSFPAGLNPPLLHQACADFMKLGEPAATLLGLLVNAAFVLIFLCFALFRSSSSSSSSGGRRVLN